MDCLGGEDRQRVGRRRHGERLAGHHVDADIGDDALHAELRILPADIAAGEPAGVVGFVLDPQPHAPLGRFLDGEFHLVHVFRRKVLRLAASRREVHHEDAIGCKLVEIADDPCPDLLRVGAVPTGKRLDGAVFVRRRFEIRGHIAEPRESVISCQGR